MRKSFHKLTAFTMALVVLFSTMSFTVDMHYCGDILVDTAIFSKVENCGMEMNTNDNNGCSIVKEDCCGNQQIHFKGQEDLKPSLEQITFEQQIFVASFVQSYALLFLEETSNHVSSLNYTPPLVTKEIHKLDEVYLI